MCRVKLEAFAKGVGGCKKGGAWRARVVVAPPSSTPSRQTSASPPPAHDFRGALCLYGYFTRNARVTADIQADTDCAASPLPKGFDSSYNT